MQNEQALIHRVSQIASRSGQSSAFGALRLGTGDDAALFRPRTGYETILTCDWFLEGTHFLRKKHPPEAVGWKCLARALSDIAAMGGAPRCFLLSLALPESHAGRWLDRFLGGLRRASRRFQCALAGGDTTRNRKILINVTVIGESRAGQAALRTGARAGDFIYVSGRLGEAAFGLQMLRGSKGLVKTSTPQLKKHLYPEPRLALGSWLTKNRIVTAMMDLSDGLSSDLPRLCDASGVGARLEAARIPMLPNENARSGRGGGANTMHLALHGGDDYELLFTVPRRSADRIPGSFQGVRLTAIGEITRNRQLRLIRKDGAEEPLIPGGWDPFR